MKIKLIGDISDGSDLIKKFKNMNHVLLIVKKSSNNLICLYQKDTKGTHLNQFILSLSYSFYYNYLCYADIKNMPLENDQSNEDFSEKFSKNIGDCEECIGKKKEAELFRIL